MNKNKLLLILIIVIAIVLICLSSILYVSGKSDKNEFQVYKYYTSVEVHDGDTLWDLAQLHTHGIKETTIETYIKEVKRLNHLKSDIIYADAYLTIPYYKTEFIK